MIRSHLLCIIAVILEQDIFCAEEVEHGIEKGSDISGEDHSIKKRKNAIDFSTVLF